MVKLSNWLEVNLENNISNTLEGTIEGLLQLNPPIKKTVANKKKALQSSMKSLLSNKEKLQNKYEILNKWIIEKEEKKRKLNIVNETNCALFKRARISSCVVNVDLTCAASVHHERNAKDILNYKSEKNR